MTGTYAYQEILFLDTLSHEKSDILNLDHVKFTFPVYIDEIRIIPKNCNINLSNGSIIGETLPQTFKIEFFGNNLNRNAKERSTFDRLASITYKIEDDNIIRPISMPIDWLIIKGSYTSVTVVVIGVKAKHAEKENNIQNIKSNLHDVKPNQTQQYNNENQSNTWIETTTFNQPQFNMIASPRMPANTNNGLGLLPTPPNMLNNFQSPLISNNTFNGTQGYIQPYQQQQQQNEQHFKSPPDSGVTRIQQNNNEHFTPPINRQQQQQQQQNFTSNRTPTTTTPINKPPSNEHISSPPIQKAVESAEVVSQKKPQIEIDNRKQSPDTVNKVTTTAVVVVNDVEMKSETNDIKTEIVDGGSGSVTQSQKQDNDVENDNDNDNDADDELDELQLYYTNIAIDEDFNELCSSLNTFNPFKENFDIPTSLSERLNPTLTNYEQKLLSIKHNRIDLKTKLKTKLSIKLIKLINEYKTIDSHNEIWLQQCEKLFSSKSLIDSFVEINTKQQEMMNVDDEEDKNVYDNLINTLIDWSLESINYDSLVKLRNKYKEQAKQMFKIRQLKFGLNLITFLATQLNENVCKQLLNKNVQIKLLQLIDNENVYLQMKLNVLKTLDSMLYYTCGIKEFLNFNDETTTVVASNVDISLNETVNGDVTQQATNKPTTSNTKTAYSRLIQLFLNSNKKTSSSRLNNLIAKILLKVTFFDLLNRFRVKTKQLITLNDNSNNINSDNYCLINDLHDMFIIIFYIWQNSHKQLAQNDNIIKKLPIKLLFVNQILTQQQEIYLIEKLFFSNLFSTVLSTCEINDVGTLNESLNEIQFINDPCLAFIYRLFNEMNTFKSLIIVWSHPIVQQIRIDIQELIESFFYSMISSSDSLNYLINNSKLTQALIKLLNKKATLNSTINLDDLQLNCTNSLSNQLIYSLQTMIYIFNIDEIYMNYLVNNKVLNDNGFQFYLNFLNNLQSLCIFLTNNNTRCVLVRVFTFNKHVEVLINLLKLIYKDEYEKFKSKSGNINERNNEEQLKRLILSSIIEIIYSIFKYNDCNINFYKNYSTKLSEVLKLYMITDEKVKKNATVENVSGASGGGGGSETTQLIENNFNIVTHLNLKLIQEKLKYLNDYIQPHLHIKAYSYECINYLVKNLKLFTNTIINTFNNISQLSQTFIQILRLLKYLCIPPMEICNDSNQREQKYASKYEILSEFNHKRCLAELINLNCLDELLQILNKLSNYIQYSYQTVTLLNADEKNYLLKIIKLSLELIEVILGMQIKMRKNKFNNLSCLKYLFNVYNSVYLYFDNTIAITSASNATSSATSNTTTASSNSVTNLTTNNMTCDDANLIKNLLLNIFTLFMQQEIQHEGTNNVDEEANNEIDDENTDILQSISIHKSFISNNNLYKCLFKELCKFIIDKPINYIGGVRLFIELLPLPLPIIMKYNRNDDEKQFLNVIKYERKLLDFNLTLIDFNLRLLIRQFALNTNSQLQQIFKRFCVQLADISSNLCLIVLRTILDFIIELIEQEKFVYYNQYMNEIELHQQQQQQQQQVINVNTALTSSALITINTNSDIDSNDGLSTTNKLTTLSLSPLLSSPPPATTTNSTTVAAVYNEDDYQIDYDVDIPPANNVDTTTATTTTTTQLPQNIENNYVDSYNYMLNDNNILWPIDVARLFTFIATLVNNTVNSSIKNGLFYLIKLHKNGNQCVSNGSGDIENTTVTNPTTITTTTALSATQSEFDKYRLLILNSINYCLINSSKLHSSELSLNENLQQILIHESIYYLIQIICDNNNIYDETSHNSNNNNNNKIDNHNEDNTLSSTTTTTTTTSVNNDTNKSKHHHHQLNLFKSLPDYTLLKLIIRLLIDHLNNTKFQTIQITEYVLNTLILLTHHDYGFELIIHELHTNHEYFNFIYNFINEFNLLINTKLKRQSQQQQQNFFYLLNLLTLFCEFIRLLIPPITASTTAHLTVSSSVPSNLNSLENSLNSNTSTAAAAAAAGIALNGNTASINTTLIRTSHISVKTFKEMFKWTDNQHENEQHPFIGIMVQLDNLIKNSNSNIILTDDNTQLLLDLYNDTNGLLKYLRSIEPLNFNDEKYLFLNSHTSSYKFLDDLIPDELLFIEKNMLDLYYQHRLIYVIDDLIMYDDIDRYENERFSSYDDNYDDSVDIPQPQPPTQLQESSNSGTTQSECNNITSYLQIDKIEIDIDDLVKTYLQPNFDLTNELSKEFGDVIADKQNKTKKRVKQPEVINTRTGFRYKAPMRGGHNSSLRGFGGVMHPFLMSNRSDPFRSRQPNTSRPPSVHVDDFYRLQSQENALKMSIPSNMNQQQEIDMQQDWNDWNNPRQMQPSARANSFNGVSNQHMNMVNSRSRFLMPPGTYSINNTQLSSRDRMSGEFLSPMPPPTHPQMISPRFTRMPVSHPIDRRHSFSNIEQIDDMTMRQQQQQQQQMSLNQLQPRYSLYPAMRPGFRGANTNMNRRMPIQPYMRAYQPR